MTSRRRCTRVLLLLVVLVGSAFATPAHADSGDELARARAKFQGAQAAADAAAARYEEALVAHARLEDDLARTRDRISGAVAREETLRNVVQDIAVRAYVGGGEPIAGVVLFGGDELLDLGRTSRLLDRANAPKVDAIDELAGVRADLERDREHLAAAKDSADALLTQLEGETRRVQDELLVADATRDRLATQFAQEQEQIRLLTAARRAEESARAQATSTTRPATARVAPPAARGSAPAAAPAPPAPAPKPRPTNPPANPPPTGGLVCPVRGALTFVDSWGAPRSGGRGHQGVDLMSARGTPNVAITSGTIAQKGGALSGNGVFLAGDDGNSYWYFHLDRYEGGPRHVAQGEVIGYTGSTGNADGGAPHTHFEYHPGGGGASNPYPLVRPIC